MKIQNRSKKGLLYWKTCRILQKFNGTLRNTQKLKWKIQNSNKKFKTQAKNLKTSSKKLKVPANPLGLLAENASKKKAGLKINVYQEGILQMSRVYIHLSGLTDIENLTLIPKVCLNIRFSWFLPPFLVEERIAVLVVICWHFHYGCSKLMSGEIWYAVNGEFRQQLYSINRIVVSLRARSGH